MAEQIETVVLELDEDDARALHEAIAKFQNMRIDGECIIPDGEGNLRGRLVAEICRGWMEMLSLL